MVAGALAAAAAVLLLVAGAAKLGSPGPAAAMIVAFTPIRRLARARLVARGAGTIELAAGLATLSVGGRVSVAALAACYLVLTVVALRLAAADGHASCGCFGTADGEVGLGHVLLNLAGLGVAGWAVLRPPGGVAGLFDQGTLTGVTACGQALLLAALGYLSITALPALSAARRTVEGAA